MTTNTGAPFDQRRAPARRLHDSAGKVWTRLTRRPAGEFRIEHEYPWRSLFSATCQVGRIGGRDIMLITFDGPQHLFAEFWYAKDAA